MTDEAIARARSLASSINSAASSLGGDCEQLNSDLSSNGNYQFFRLGSDRGATIDSDLKTTTTTAIDKLVVLLQGAASSINACCDRQAELNRIRRMQEEAERNSLDSTTGVNNTTVPTTDNGSFLG